MILVKTDAGQQAFKDRSVRLTPRQRSAFILFDGRRSVSEVLDAGTGVAREEVDQMIELGLLGQAVEAVAVAHAAAVAVPLEAALPSPQPSHATTPSATALEGRSSQQRYKDAYPVATQLTGSLGLRGFRLNLAVEGTSTFEELLALAPKIRAAVGPEKAAVLDRVLAG